MWHPRKDLGHIELFQQFPFFDDPLGHSRGLIKNIGLGIPLWHSELRIQHCYCSSSGHCCGMGWIPGQGTPTCPETAKKKKKSVLVWLFITVTIAFWGLSVPSTEGNVILLFLELITFFCSLVSFHSDRDHL